MKLSIKRLLLISIFSIQLLPMAAEAMQEKENPPKKEEPKPWLHQRLYNEYREQPTWVQVAGAGPACLALYSVPVGFFKNLLCLVFGIKPGTSTTFDTSKSIAEPFYKNLPPVIQVPIALCILPLIGSAVETGYTLKSVGKAIGTVAKNVATAVQGKN